MTTWLRTQRFDVTLQLGALIGIAPALVIHAAVPGAASSLLPLGTLIAIPFIHVFGSFFVAFTPRNQSATTPRQLALLWAGWLGASAALQLAVPRLLATFALLYGGWHIFRQNFGFLRELAARERRAADARLRWLDHAATAAPAVALWLLVSDRGPWFFLGVELHHTPVPPWLLALALTAVPATAILRARTSRLRGLYRDAFPPAKSASGPGVAPAATLSSPAAWLLLAGNAAALLGPALFLHDLTLIYTLAASYHGIQYLMYIAERERERHPHAHPERVLAPLASAIFLAMVAWFGLLALLPVVLPTTGAEQMILIAWYAIVPFHYFVDGRIWKRRKR